MRFTRVALIVALPALVASLSGCIVVPARYPYGYRAVAVQPAPVYVQPRPYYRPAPPPRYDNDDYYYPRGR